jgi:hypothetical protein
MLIRTAAVLMFALLAGCDGSSSSGAGAPEPTAKAPTAATPEVAARITGAYSGTFESTGSIFCSKDALSGGEGFELYAMKMPEQLNLKMPRATKPGQYTITDGAGAPIDFYYTDPHRVKYDQIRSADIRLVTVPQAQGERLTGDITGTLESDDGQSVNVDIHLDLDAGAQSFDECG